MHSLTLVETKTCSLFQVENSSNEKEFFLAVGGALVENNYSNVVLRADSKNRNISSSITTSEASLPNSVFVCSKVAAVDGQTVSLSIKALHGNNYPGPLTFPINSSNEIMAFYYNIDSQALVVGLKDGDILSISEQEWELEPVGIVDSGILSMKPSPDGELVVIVTGPNDAGVSNLILMTRDFDIVSEIPLATLQTTADSFVNVGWGKKETQFHGKAGKQAALDKSAKKNSLSSDDDLKPRISWRGDGDCFCVSHIVESKRTLFVYNREAILQSVSETVPNLEHFVAWKPSGSLIAASQKTHKHEIVFFEKNGLRHGEFTLADKDCTVHTLCWNADSSLLAMYLTIREEGVERFAVQLWGSNNYHWYLRHEIRGQFSQIDWDLDEATILHTLRQDGLYQYYQFTFDVLKSSSLDTTNNGTVAVIDGRQVLFTPFKKHNVPPPMSFLQTKHSDPVIHLAFDPSPLGGSVAVLLSNRTIDFWNGVDGSQKSKSLLGSISLENVVKEPRQVIWAAQNTLFVLSFNHQVNSDQLHVVVFDNDYKTIESINLVPLPMGISGISRLIFDVPSNTVAIQSNSGVLFEVNEYDGEYFASQKCQFPSPCKWISAASIGESDQKMRVWIGLTGRNKLYANTKLLASDCTSFCVHNDFLIISTLDHIAKFISLQNPLDNFEIIEKDENSIGFNEKHRRIEQGSSIVLAVPAHTNLVLQMPRGNLETIFPRALVLSTVRKSIESKEYRAAFLMCRKHRIDMNLLIDHDYDQFSACINEFVEQIPEVDFLNLLITSLKDEDVTKAMYQSSGKSPVTENKLNSVCDMMRMALESKKSSKYHQPILTSLAKKSPPALEDAMLRIASIKTEESPEASEEALKYLIFLVNVDSLYNVALGIYDFPLVLLVAQHSHKDPREYLPFLTNLKKLEENYRKHKIDDHLEKFGKALVSLSLCHDRNEEFLEYMNKHRLYKLGLTCFEPKSEMYNMVLLNFAVYQTEQCEFSQSGMLFEMSGKIEDALEAYTLALMWKKVFTLCKRVGIDLASYAERLVEGLIENRRFEEAALICAEYLKIPVKSVDILIKGGLWSRAIFLASEHQLTDIMESIIKPELFSYSQNLLAELLEDSTTFEKQVLRLREVRIAKTQVSISASNGGEVNDDRLDNIDMLSDTASMATTRITASTGRTSYTGMSSMTAKTGKTSRARRKLARKRAAGKDAAFEDEFLIKSLKKAIEKVNAQAAEMNDFLITLMTEFYIQEAKQIQECFGAYLSKIKRHIDEIFDTPVIPLPTLNSEGLVDENVDSIPQVILKPQLTEIQWALETFDSL